MNWKMLFILTGMSCLGRAYGQMNFERIDTTMKLGKTGFRVTCRNRDIKNNQLSIRPIGFESPANENMNLPVRGRVSAVQVDDLNGDGDADLVLFIYTDSAAIHGTVIALVSDGTKSLLPCALPDPALDGKINAGYKGYDQFTLLEGTLLLKFPVFRPDDKDKPTGGHRVIQYTFVRNDAGNGYKLNIARTYDTH
jgi:hypothetical protein